MTQKSVFWQALLLTILVFGIGILLGYSLENIRTNDIARLYAQSELELLDMRAQNDILSMPLDCTQLIKGNVNFADRIFNEAKILDRYESATELSEAIQVQHQKYDILRTLFWINSVQIKQKCNNPFHTIVYLYKYNTTDLIIKTKQSVISRELADIKEKYGGQVMLIPIAGDNGLASVSAIMGVYNISEQDLPIILIDEKYKITNLENKNEIEQYLK